MFHSYPNLKTRTNLDQEFQELQELQELYFLPLYNNLAAVDRGGRVRQKMKDGNDTTFRRTGGVAIYVYETLSLNIELFKYCNVILRF